MRLFFWIYTLLIYASLPAVLLRLRWKAIRQSAYKERIAERLGFYRQDRKCSPVDIWLHAVSFGEVEVAKSLIKQLLAEGQRLCITTTTVTGSKRVQQLFGDKVHHVYLPYELPAAIKRFIAKYQPKKLVIVETELWPNLIRQVSLKKIPITIINARLSEKSVKGYLYIKRLMRYLMTQLTKVICQSDADGQRFLQLGLAKEQLIIAGNLKFDALPTLTEPNEIEPMAKQLFNQRPIWIAASTHAGEEAMLLRVFIKLKQHFPDLILVIAPRHPERVNEVTALLKQHQLGYVQRTQNQSMADEQSVFILDTLGELITFYQLSTLAFIGGSLVPHGGHNALEAIHAGVPIITGKYMDNFQFIQQQLLKQQAVIEVEDQQALYTAIYQLLTEPQSYQALTQASSQFIEKHSGGLAVTLDNLS